MTNPVYQQIVSHAADSEPQLWTDLPELSSSDIQVICASKPGDVIEELREGELPELLVLDQATGRNGAVRNPVQMEQACRRALYRDVEKLLDARDEEREQERATLRHCRLAGYRTGTH